MSNARWVWAILLAATSSAGCGDSGPTAHGPSAVERYGIGWVFEDDGRYVLRTSLGIDAPASRVWELVRDVNDYASWSGSLTAHADALEPGAPIDLAIQLLDPPAPMTGSRETIEVVDDALYAVSWGRQFPFEQTSERWQLVEADGRSACRYHTALAFSQGLGALMEVTLGPRTLAAFEAFARDLSAEASRL